MSAFSIALHRFYRSTAGNQRLLTRALRAAMDVRSGTAEAGIIPSPQGNILAAALLYRHSEGLAEIGSVLVAPEGEGLYPVLRQRLAHHAGSCGRTVTLFERLPDDDPEKLDYERARRQAEGWQVMSCEHEDYRLVERSKMGMPLSNGGKPPKIGFRRAARQEDSLPFVYKPVDDFACFPFRYPGFSLGR